MKEVLLKSFTFIAIIVIGNVLKHKGFFKKEDSSFLSKIVMTLTLPSALLASSASLTLNSTTIIILIVGLVSNTIMARIGKIFFSKESKIQQGSAMINCSGYNIGNVTIPFVSAFFQGTGMSFLYMFDIGNSISWMGGVYASANRLAKGDSSQFSIKSLAKTLSKSIPFMTYIFIITLVVFNLRLPSQITSIFGTIGAANSFLVFLMIGVMLDIHIDKSQIKSVVKILIIRLTGFLVMSLIVYFLLPLPMIAKQVTILCLASPIPSSANVFSKELGDDSSIPALVNSIALIIGIFCSSMVLTILT